MTEKPTFSKEELKVPAGHMGTKELLTEKPSYFGIILSILIVLLMCVLGGLYAWSELMQNNTTLNAPVSRPTAAQNNEPESTNAEAEVETMGAMSTSDELDLIQADLESTPIDEEKLEADFNAVEAELGIQE